MHKITPSVFSTSVFNPNMRTFDVIMRTEFGTSYNSYVVKGEKEIALIEASQKSFGENYLENVEEVLDGAIPDYLIMNHTEPDHSGSINAVLEKYPDIKIVITQAGANFLKGIANNDDLDPIIVKDGDTIDLGGKTLSFIIAPLLHWPDTMFTWLEEDKILFSCDFLGSHYCEPQMFDSRIIYTHNFYDAVKGYFDAIFRPFLPYVRKGLEKIANLDIEFACTSHGPVLTKGVELEYVIDHYKEWSKEQSRENKLIPIFYCSAYGNTAQLASAIQKGILKVYPDAEVNLYDMVWIEPASIEPMINESNAFLLGSPTINREAVAPIWKILSLVDVINIAKKPVALFGSYGWSGEALPHLADRLNQLKVNLFEQQFKVNFVPSEADLEAAEDFGVAFAKNFE